MMHSQVTRKKDSVSRVHNFTATVSRSKEIYTTDMHTNLVHLRLNISVREPRAVRLESLNRRLMLDPHLVQASSLISATHITSSGCSDNYLSECK